MKVKVKMNQKLNEEIQKIRVIGFLNHDIKLNRTYFSKILGFEDDPSYDLQILLDNINDNSFPLIFTCINKVLKEDDVNRQNLYCNLSKYKFKNKVSDPNFSGCIQCIFDDKSNDYHLEYSVMDDSLFIAMHEFNHFSSFFVNDSNINCGFQTSKRVYSNKGSYEKYIAGTGINEGYTDYMTSLQIFNGEPCKEFGDKVMVVGYPICYQYAKCLDKIIGHDKMKYWYYSGRFDSLFDEVAKYSNEEDAKMFFDYLDYFSIVDSKKYKPSNRELNINILECSKFLKQLSTNKYGSDIIEDINIKYVNRKGIPKQIEEKIKSYFEDSYGGLVYGNKRTIK